MNRLLKSFALAVVGAASLGSAALADDIRIRYDDLDLTRPADAAAFDERAKRAVADYCAVNFRRFEGQPMSSPMRACKREAALLVRYSMPRQQRRDLQIARSRAAAVELAQR